MPLLLRVIRKNRWECPDPYPEWASEGELLADPLGDLFTKENRLSLWHIEDDESNLERIVVGIAGTRDSVSNLDMLLFDVQVLSEVGFKIEHSIGGSIAEEANRNWHRDVVDLTARKIVRLAELMMEKGRCKRLTERRVLTLLKVAAEAGAIELNNLKGGVRRKF